MNAEMKATTAKIASKKNNEDMQAKISEEEREAREVTAKGELPASMKNLIAKEHKRLFNQEKKKQREKSLGGNENQESKPT